MGHKKVCLECKVTLNRSFDSGSESAYPCPGCGKQMILLPHRFRPPKKSEHKKWETVKFLINNGFYFQHIYEKTQTEDGCHQHDVAYPDNLRDAQEFVTRYKSQARQP